MYYFLIKFTRSEAKIWLVYSMSIFSYFLLSFTPFIFKRQGSLIRDLPLFL